MKKLFRKIILEQNEHFFKAYWKNILGKNSNVAIIHYKTIQHEVYDFDLGGGNKTELFYDTILKVDNGPEYLYESGEFQVTKYLRGYSMFGPSYYFSYAYPSNQDLIKRNEFIIKKIENVVGRRIISRNS